MKHINELLEQRLEQMEGQQDFAMNRMRIRNLLAKVRAKRAERRRAAAAERDLAVQGGLQIVAERDRLRGVIRALTEATK